MKVLSLFDGISCGYLALQRAGIPIETYYASEIDKTCIKVSQKHFPNIIQLGDVNNWRTWDIPWKDIDLVMGGCWSRPASLSPPPSVSETSIWIDYILWRITLVV